MLRNTGRNWLAMCMAAVVLPVVSVNARAQGAVPARPAITGIAFLRVYTTDVAAAKKFYGTTLGFAERQVGEALVFPVNRHQWVELETSAPPQPDSRLAALGFTTANVAAMERYLRARGVVPEGRAQAGEVAVRDPEGNLVVFVERGASGPEARAAAEAPRSATAPGRHMIHVGFVARDQAKEDAFWRDVLGFRPYWHGGMAGRTDWVSMQVPDGTDWMEYMLGQGDHPSLRQAGVMNHFSLGVERMQTVLAGLQANGCEDKQCTAIQAGRDGKVQLNVFDPDGTRVEYMELVPAMKPCCSEFTASHPKPEE